MQNTNSSAPEKDVVSEEQQKLEEERQKLVAQIVKLPNGARFTRLKPMTAA
jgi:hypothetical protein